MKRALDGAIYSFLTRGLDDATLARYAEAVEKQEEARAARVFQTLDTKATGLLTHCSMMIAGLGLVAPIVSQSDIELGIVIAEMAGYLLLAIGCLRCLSVFAGRDIDEEMEARLGRELIIRRELLSICNRGTIILTIIVFVLLPIQFMFVPPKAG
jgi:hypothetical protein